MPNSLPDPLFDAAAKARGRTVMPTSLDTVGLRGLEPEMRLNSVFTARGTSVIFASIIKEVVDTVAAGDMDIATARVTLLETIKALGYTPDGGFPTLPGDAEGKVPPAMKGTLQDLSSFRRLDLIIRTQLELMAGAGLKYRGETPARLEAAPAWELVRVQPRKDHRAWLSRWTTAGGKEPYPHDGSFSELYSSTGLIALKGDPLWGELGSSNNFADALDTDHPPFAFTSGVGWLEVKRDRCLALDVRGPNGESIKDWLAGRPITYDGKLPLPSPTLSTKDMDPDLLDDFKKATGAEDVPGKPGIVRLTPAERARRALALIGGDS